MITRNRILLALGVAIVLLPFSGFPGSYETFFSVVFGLAVVFLAFLYARDKRMIEPSGKDPRPELMTEVYVQNQPARSASKSEDDSDDGEDKFTDIDAIKEHSRKIKTPVN